MSIKNILVSFNGTENSVRAVKLAAALARRCDAHLTGLFAHAIPYTYLQMETYLTQSALDIMAENARESEEQIRHDFADVIASAEQGLRASFFCAQGFPNDVLVRFGRTYDLIVAAQPNEKETLYTDVNPDRVAMLSGRPVIVAPRGYEELDLDNGAIVAWDGKRAAARALSDAMDLLEQKHKVSVLHVGHEDDIRQPGEDIMEHLSRHGLDASLNVQPPGQVSTSDLILNTCAESDAGLLVMGAYEHSAFSEMLLGGVTRDVVAQSHIPVLMSH